MLNVKDIPAEMVSTIKTAAFILLSLGSLSVMYGAFGSGIMVFSLVQIDFLFPTPVNRRHVLILKLAKDYIKYLTFVALAFLYFSTQLLREVNVPLFPMGLITIASVTALILTVVNISHTINIVFTFGFERLRQARLLLKAAIVVIPASAIVFGFFRYQVTGNAIQSLLLAANSPLMNVILAPVHWCADLALAPLLGVTPEEWTNFWLLWVLAAGSFILLLSRNENLYEPSLGVSAKVARRRQLFKSRGFAEMRVEKLREKGTKRVKGLAIPFFGLGATALIWKSLTIRYRTTQSQLIFMLILPLIIVYVVRHYLGSNDMIRYTPFLMIYLAWIFLLSTLVDLRADLKFVNILKSMPIAPWKIVCSQIASSLIYLTAGTTLFAIYIYLLLPLARTEILVACAIAVPFIGFANVSAALLVGLLYPDARDFTTNYVSGMIGGMICIAAMAPTIIIIGAGAALRLPTYAILVPICIIDTIIGLIGVAICSAIFRKFDPTND